MDSVPESQDTTFWIMYCVRLGWLNAMLAAKIPHKSSTTNTCLCVVAKARQCDRPHGSWGGGGVGWCSGGQVKTWQAEKNLHSASGRKLRLTKRLAQESSQTVSSAVHRTNTPHRLDTPGFPLCWHPSPKTFFLLSEEKKEVSWH